MLPLLLLPAAALAAVPAELLIEIPLSAGRESARELAGLDVGAYFSLDAIDLERGVATAYGSQEGFDAVAALGFAPRVVPNPAVAEMTATRKRAASLGASALLEYHDYDELTALLFDLEARYPSLAKVGSMGESVQGRELWYLDISDNVGENEVGEPEFLFQNNMHGDETVGREATIELAQEILAGYGSDPELTALVNNTHITILFSMNPDGFELARRSNANGVDLNRAFPDQFRDPVDSTEGRPTEVQHAMNFVRSRSLTLSAGTHGGIICANYPFDGTESGRSVYSESPDDDVYRFLALTYSFAHDNMASSRQFTDGITNGADWYTVYGGWQDWAYVYNGVLDITLELSVQKYPPASELAGFYEDNRDALVEYLKLAQIGVRGVVTNGSGAPVTRAKVFVDDREIPVYTDRDHGDYYRLLLPGTYTITVEAEGYSPLSRTVVVRDDQPTIADFVLA